MECGSLPANRLAHKRGAAMRGYMSNLVMRRITPEGLVVLPLAGLVALLAARESLGIQADPMRVMVAFFAGLIALVLVARYPAAFIAPVLFLPRLKDVSVFNGLGPAANWTALQVAVALLGAGAFLRWLRGTTHPDDSRAAYWDADPTSGEVLSGSRLRLSEKAPVAFLLFAAVVSASYLYTPSPVYGGTKLFGFLTLGAASFLAPVLLFRSKRDFRDFTIGAVLFGMVVAASSLSFSATGAMGATANPAHIGKGQVIGLAMLLLLSWPYKQPRIRALILLVCIPWLALGMVSAETRGPLFSLLFVLLLSYFFPAMRSPLISRRQMTFAFVALVGAMMLLSVFWFYGSEASRFRSKSDEIVALVRDTGEAHGTAVMRLTYYRGAFDAWLDALCSAGELAAGAWCFGSGTFGSIRTTCSSR